MRNMRHKVVLFTLILIFSLLTSACTSDDSESADFGNDDSKSITNALPSANQEAKSGGVPWVEVNKQLGHKWKLTYNHASATALFEVAIVNWDLERNALTDVFFGCEYEFVNSDRKGDSVRLELDSLKDRIEDCYTQAGQPRNISRFEQYPGIQFEVSGEFQQPTGGGLFTHPSFKYGINQSGNNVGMFLSAQGITGRIEGESNSISANAGIADFHAASNLDFWTSLQDSNVQLSYLEHYVWADPTKIDTTAKKEMGRVNAVVFDLGKSDLEITPPPGFLLDILIVDPFTPGKGGG